MVPRCDRVDYCYLHGSRRATMVLMVVSTEPSCAWSTVPPVACMSFIQAPSTCGCPLRKCLTNIRRFWVFCTHCIVYAPGLVTLKCEPGPYSIGSLCCMTIKLVCVFHPLTSLAPLPMLKSYIPASLWVRQSWPLLPVTSSHTNISHIAWLPCDHRDVWK